MTERDELLEQFLVEGRELLVRGRRDLGRLAGTATDRGALDGLFRSLHTLKGSTGLFALAPLTSLLHAAEAQLDEARAAGALARERVDGLGRALDEVEIWLDVLDRGGKPSADLARRAQGLSERLQEAAPPAEPEPPAGAADWAPALVADSGRQGPLVAIRYAPGAEAYFRGEDPLAIVREIPGLVRLRLSADPATDRVTYDPFRCTLKIEALSDAPLDDVRQALRLVFDQVELIEVAAAQAGGGLRLRALRVDAERLDSVAALVDELVIAKNALAHQTAELARAFAGTAQERELTVRQAALERVAGQLHAAITSLRLAPLSHLFSRFPRQVRELAEGLDKDVDLLVTGEQVSLDKSVVEGLFEPMLHLLRNAVDHGVETRAARLAAGKPERARITIAAHAQADEVVVEIVDDGRGIDLARVRAAAVARGVISAEAASGLSNEAAARLVFAPGFSTKGQVSAISGRGVGMDAVHDAVTRMGGRVALENRPGEGLSVRLILPAQVVLTKILVVEAGGERFGVPLEGVSETHRVRLDEVTRVRAGRAYVRRDRVIPLLRLAELLGGASGPDGEVFPVLNVVVGDEAVGVQIDRLGERVEAPLRPMNGLMSAYPGLLGTVLEGDGRVLLILDLAELAT